MEKESETIRMHAGASPKIFQLAAKLRNNLTEPEKKLWEFLKHKPEGFKFRRQHPFGVYILDFYCHRKRLSIEIDGESHNKAEQVKIDEYRTDFLNEMGINEIRIKNAEVMIKFESVKQNIFEVLREGSL